MTLICITWLSYVQTAKRGFNLKIKLTVSHRISNTDFCRLFMQPELLGITKNPAANITNI